MSKEHIPRTGRNKKATKALDKLTQVSFPK